MRAVYQPNTGLTARIKRRLVPFMAQRPLAIKLDRPLISFTFDDCPKSVLKGGLVPLEREGWLGTVYISMGRCGITNHLGLHMNHADVKAVDKAGHEIGDHTFSHIDAANVSLDDFQTDIDRNQKGLAKLGIPPSRTFAYPYGQVTESTKRAMGERFKGARGITSRLQDRRVDLNQIKSNRLYAGKDFDVLLGQIERMKDNPGWLTIFTHDVRDNPSRYGCTSAQIQTVINAVKNIGANVMTVANAIDHLEARA